MTKQVSFTKFENKLVHDFRKNLNKAESTEDVKKFFVYTTRELLDNVLEGRVGIDYGDISLRPDRSPHYHVEDRLSSTDAFSTACKNSDLKRVLERFAENASSRFRHLEKNPLKTIGKIRN